MGDVYCHAHAWSEYSAPLKHALPRLRLILPPASFARTFPVDDISCAWACHTCWQGEDWRALRVDRLGETAALIKFPAVFLSPRGAMRDDAIQDDAAHALQRA